MRDASPELTTRLAAGSTTLATLLKIVPSGPASIIRWTDHDTDISIADGLYTSSPSCVPQAIVSTAGFGVSNTERSVIFSGTPATGLVRTDLLRGAYDDATFIISVVDWLYPQYGTITLMSGRFGSMVIDNAGQGSISFAGLVSRLDRMLGERYSAACRADFGDARCKVDLVAGIGAVKATAPLTLDGNANAGETVTIDTQTYTWRAAVTTIANEIKIGVNAIDSVHNLAQAVNGGTGSGTLYGSLTVAHATADASRSDKTATFTAKVGGTAANAFASTETMANGSFAGATFAGGVAGLRLKTAATITTVTSSSKIIITPGLTITDGFLNMGVIVWDPATSNAGQAMEILVDIPGVGSAHQLTLALGMPYTPLVGDTVIVYAGCDKQKTTCDVRYKNFINMRAEWGIPGSDAQQVVA